MCSFIRSAPHRPSQTRPRSAAHRGRRRGKSAACLRSRATSGTGGGLVGGRRRPRRGTGRGRACAVPAGPAGGRRARLPRGTRSGARPPGATHPAPRGRVQRAPQTLIGAARDLGRGLRAGVPSRLAAGGWPWARPGPGPAAGLPTGTAAARVARAAPPVAAVHVDKERTTVSNQRLPMVRKAPGGGHSASVAPKCWGTMAYLRDLRVELVPRKPCLRGQQKPENQSVSERCHVH